MQRINKYLYVCLFIFLIISLMLVEKNDKLYHCVVIGIENHSTSFFIAIPDDENNISITRYTVDGNDYENALKKAKMDGVNIDLTALRSICISDDLSLDNKIKFNKYAKDAFNVSCLVFECKIEILLEKDVFGNEGVFAINDLYGKNNGGIIYLDFLLNRKILPKIIYENYNFIRV